MILGIDPGASGALVVLDLAGHYVDHLIMPTTKIGKANRVDGRKVAMFLREYPAIRYAFIERVHAIPRGGKVKMGASTSFAFGHSAGKVECAVEVLGIPFTLVFPPNWKKHAGLIGKDKDASRLLAKQLYPDLRVLDQKGKGQAVADAILIARYGMAATPFLSK
jgi:crossover junction endodeoxyribonuclease RuvC